MDKHSINLKKTKAPYSFSLRSLLVFSVLLGLSIGLVSRQQLRHRRYYKIAVRVERLFGPYGCIPNEIATAAERKYADITSLPVRPANNWGCSVSNSSDGIGFISAKHRLTYQPSFFGDYLANVTIVTSWHILESEPTITIHEGGGIFDDLAVKRLKRALKEDLGVEPTTAPLE